MSETSPRAGTVNSVQAKLQRFIDDLPEDEALVAEALVTRRASVFDAAGGAGLNRGEETSIIIVGGRGARWFRVDLGDFVALNPQPLPPEPPPDIAPIER